jgi:hypothetical protein
MSFDEPSRDRQTKPGPAVSWGPCCIHPEESLKDALMIFSSNSDPVVGNGKAAAVPRCPGV